MNTKLAQRTQLDTATENASLGMAVMGVVEMTTIETALREAVKALDEMADIADQVDGWPSFPIDPIDRARSASARAEEALKQPSQPIMDDAMIEFIEGMLSLIHI
jgi:hypothetical protein